jgi:hypothetical protein
VGRGVDGAELAKAGTPWATPRIRPRVRLAQWPPAMPALSSSLASPYSIQSRSPFGAADRPPFRHWRDERRTLISGIAFPCPRCRSGWSRGFLSLLKGVCRPGRTNFSMRVSHHETLPLPSPRPDLNSFRPSLRDRATGGPPYLRSPISFQNTPLRMPIALRRLGRVAIPFVSTSKGRDDFCAARPPFSSSNIRIKQE